MCMRIPISHDTNILYGVLSSIPSYDIISYIYIKHDHRNLFEKKTHTQSYIFFFGK